MSFFGKFFGGKVTVEDVSTGEKYRVVDFPDGGIHRVVVRDKDGKEKTVLTSSVRRTYGEKEQSGGWGLDW